MSTKTLQKRSTDSPESSSAPSSRPLYVPDVDIYETDDEVVVVADVPGSDPASIDVRFENGELTLHARGATLPERKTPPLHREFLSGDFYRSFRISEAIDPDGIGAEHKAGVLTIRLPKREVARPKRIAVQAR